MAYSISRIVLIVSFLLCLSFSTRAQIRFIDNIFDDVDSITDIWYRLGVYPEADTSQDLYFDIYQPRNDTMQKRPLIIWLHGGFAQGSRKEDKIIYFSKNLAKKGYLNASIDYRGHVFEGTSSNPRFGAIYRGVQDTRAAISYFKEHAADYNIDTSRIVVGGMSSGSYVSMQCAYLDQWEVPDTLIDTTGIGPLDLGGSNFSANYEVAINCWGALLDSNWIQAGDKPVMAVVGLQDASVPPENDSTSYGSFPICRTAARLGIKSQLDYYPDAGHGLKVKPSDYLSVSDANQRQYNYLDISAADIARFLSETLYQQDDEIADTTVKVFPNPTTSKFNVRVYDAILNDITINVNDAKGNKILSYEEGIVYDNIYKKSIDLSNYPAGVYYVSIYKTSDWFKKQYLCKEIKLRK